MTNKLFNIYKIFKKVVINKYLNEKFLYYKKQFKSSFFKIINNDKHLFIINNIVSLDRI